MAKRKVVAAAETVGSVVPGGGLVMHALDLLGKLGGRLKSKKAHRDERRALLDAAEAAAMAGVAVDAGVFRFSKSEGTTDPVAYLQHVKSAGLQEDRTVAADKLANIAAHHATGGKHAKSLAHTIAGGIEEAGAAVGKVARTPGGARAITAVARGLLGGFRPRYRTTYDAFGIPHRRRVREPVMGSSAEQAAPAAQHVEDEVASGSTSGKGIGAGGAAAAAAAGVGAYLVTQRVLQYLGDRTLHGEQAKVQADLALRDAFEDYKQEHGVYPPPAQRQVMKRAWAQQLAALDLAEIVPASLRGFISDYTQED